MAVSTKIRVKDGDYMAQNNDLLKNCKIGQHDLKKIYTDGGEMCENVVRWCTVCGAIVVDVDYDGRTNPGQIMKMRLPEIFQK